MSGASAVSVIRPFAALRPQPHYAAQVAAPPYDVVSAAEARQLAADKPWSFLHVSRPEIDLEPGADPYSPQVYQRGAANLARLIEAGVLMRDPRPSYYVYRLNMGGHVQTGLAAAASVAAYESGRIARHELTRPDKEDDRVRHIEALNAQTGPALLAYPYSAELDGLLQRAADGPPACDLADASGVRHTLWVVQEQWVADAITRAFDAMQRLYIADGHHRSAAAARIAARRNDGCNDCPGAGSHDYFLAVSFPHSEMQILPYHRLVRDLNGLSTDGLLARLRERFVLSKAGQPVQPRERGRFGMYLAGDWYELAMRPGLTAASDPVECLDVSLLSRHILEPLLGIHDPRRSPRIDFVGGVRGAGELQRRVDSGQAAVAFALFATRIEELMAVADAGRLMPPKSTWFEPKLADGLLSHVLD